MDVSLPGIIGACVGVVVGLIDYGLVAMLLRRAAEKKQSGPIRRATPGGLDLLLKVVFVVNALVFGGLGYWFGTAIGG